MVLGDWWRHGIIYQVYPRSFQDSDGDGIGDLRGITARLDHLVSMGVTALWISPIYPSPMADFGYDVADYRDIHPVFGTLADLDALLAAAHARGLRVILDYVPNHSSDRHPWFLASRSSREHPKRDWYLWRDPAPDGGPPNNWLANFGGRAWTLDAATGQYYLHSFLPEQPDLNWRNPETLAAMLDTLRFWLDRGVDGFRVDVLWLVIKDDQFRDNPPNPEHQAGGNTYNALLPIYTSDRPEALQVTQAMRAVLDAAGDRLLIGEIYLPLPRLMAYYGPDLTGAQLPFNFWLLLTPWNATAIARLIRDYEAALPAGAWPNWVLGNHDNARLATRVGALQVRAAAMLLLTLRGTPTIYYGEEIGLANTEIPPAMVQDPAELKQPGKGLGRDPERTPMPWDASAGAGFSTSKPWLPLGPDHATRNVATQAAEPCSVLAFYRTMIALRQATPALHRGAISDVAAQGEVLIFRREELFVALNLGVAPATIDAPGGKVLIDTGLVRGDEMVAGTLALTAGEGVVLAP